ncbi:hypothetical protein JOF48_001271 [Arthrobacter stackebrandtii]|uniref:Secreted protein n=1 Tax=Arthrobacter stackebrandtii TaxID=272161 RepID=A0ABS4YUJ7_9MICC|nr:hypothetical protein [Arthrobacter stackebrandtii]MBP2412472.1 hypothetical protein [Arthrobacter stackebrandtii]PYH02230.1 hypothetical protein CVV67_02010 [Arthrobacter stackebrandtii]
MDLWTVVFIVILVVIALVVVAIVTGGVMLSRGVLGLVKKGKPKYESAKRSALKVRAESTSGPVGEILRQRVSLQESLEATRRSLDVAEGTGQYTGKLPSIFATLEQAGTVMEHQLLVAQQEPDLAIQGVYAKNLAGQVEQITQTATGVRKALASAAAPAGDSDLQDLTRSLEIEATMLKNWSKTYTDLGNDQ